MDLHYIHPIKDESMKFQLDVLAYDLRTHAFDNL